MSSRWGSGVVVAIGAAILVLSFVPGWLIQERVLLGEGPRTLLSSPSAWQGQALPVVATGVGAVVAAALAAFVGAVTRRTWARVAVAALLAVGAGLLVGSLWPISQSGHASSVALSPGLPLEVATGATIPTLMLAVFALRPRAVLVGGLATTVFLAGAGSVLGRQAWLNLQEDSTQHYAQGSYTRTASGDEPTETLTLSGSTFRIGDRWSGSYQPDGLVIIFTGDPACPTMRGSYHAHAAGSNGDIRLEAIVDLCANGDRKRDLQTGTWVRDR